MSLYDRKVVALLVTTRSCIQVSRNVFKLALYQPTIRNGTRLAPQKPYVRGDVKQYTGTRLSFSSAPFETKIALKLKCTCQWIGNFVNYT